MIMVGRNVSVFIGNWQALGTTVPVPKYTADVRLKWTKPDGTLGNHEGTYTFPNVLANVPLRRLREYMEAIILCEARLAIGIDEDEE